jgi:hypothetical protein
MKWGEGTAIVGMLIGESRCGTARKNNARSMRPTNNGMQVNQAVGVEKDEGLKCVGDADQSGSSQFRQSI